MILPCIVWNNVFTAKRPVIQLQDVCFNVDYWITCCIVPWYQRCADRVTFPWEAPNYLVPTGNQTPESIEIKLGMSLLRQDQHSCQIWWRSAQPQRSGKAGVGWPLTLLWRPRWNVAIIAVDGSNDASWWQEKHLLQFGHKNCLFGVSVYPKGGILPPNVNLPA